MSPRLAFNKESARLVHFYHLAELASPPQAEPLPVSFVSPNAYWTSTEKTAFFHALARHSRWRPDLISTDIGGGKSIADVCSYIELLEQALGDARSTSRTRDKLPIAREVSEDWMHAEETMAEMLRDEEDEWQKCALKRKRAEEVRAAKRSLRQDRQEDQQGDGAQASQDLDQEEKEAWRQRLKKHKQDFASVWKREDILSSLGGKYLKAMGIMMRTLEQDERERELEIPMGTGHNPPLEPIPSSPARPTFNSVDDSQIDPALIALNTPRPMRPLTNGGPVTPQLPIFQPPQMDTPLPNADAGPSGLHPCSQPHSSPVRTFDALSNEPDLLDIPELPPDLSPASRRRVRKRLWMRRKRALTSGLSASDVITDVRKLKPGRKGKLKDEKFGGKMTHTRSPALPEGGSGTAQEDKDKGENLSDLEAVKRQRTPGLAKLKSMGVDGSFLREVGLDLFSLDNFAGLASIMSNVYGSPEEIDDDVTGPALSYSFLMLLRAHLAYFLTQLIAQILAQKQIETQQKKRIRGTSNSKRALKIKPKNVREALNIMGHKPSSKPFFRRLKNHARAAADDGGHHVVYSNLSHTSSDSSDAETDNDTIHQRDSEDNLDSTDRSSIPPSFALPSEFQLAWNSIGDQRDDTLLPEDLDEEALMKELEAEEAVDRQDQEENRELEMALWEEIGVQRFSPTDQAEMVVDEEAPRTEVSSTVSGEKKGVKSMRLRKPGGTIKSRVYISDTDSDEDGWEGSDQ